jgi:hypothetical protein
MEWSQIGGSILFVEIFSLLDGKNLARWVGSQEPIHRKVGRNPHLTPRGFLNKVGSTGSNSH